MHDSTGITHTRSAARRTVHTINFRRSRFEAGSGCGWRSGAAPIERAGIGVGPRLARVCVLAAELGLAAHGHPSSSSCPTMLSIVISARPPGPGRRHRGLAGQILPREDAVQARCRIPPPALIRLDVHGLGHLRTNRGVQSDMLSTAFEALAQLTVGEARVSSASSVSVGLAGHRSSARPPRQLRTGKPVGVSTRPGSIANHSASYRIVVPDMFRGRLT